MTIWRFPPVAIQPQTSRVLLISLVKPGVGPVQVVITEEAVQQNKSPNESLMYEVQVGAFTYQDHAQAVLAQVQG